MVKIERQYGNILCYKLFDDESWNNFEYIINLENGELIIAGDVLTSYCWYSNNTNVFLENLCNYSKEYLLNKLCYRTGVHFDLKKSIEETINNIKKYNNKHKGKILNLNEIIEFLNYISCLGVDQFYEDAEEIFKNYNSEFLNECVTIVLDYHPLLKKAVDLYYEHIIPILKKLI